MIEIVYINKAKTPLGVELDQLVHASQVFLDKCFVPIWGYPAKVLKADHAKRGQWQMLFLDDADEADSLGYHDLHLNGQPYSKIFVRTTIKDGQKVSTCACHELCEMLIDPMAQMWAQDLKDGTLYAYEVCDAVEDEEFLVEGVYMSDFVYPSFFESWHKPNSTVFDWMRKVQHPFQTLDGGYQIRMVDGHIKEYTGSAAKAHRFAREDRRLHRSEARKIKHT